MLYKNKRIRLAAIEHCICNTDAKFCLNERIVITQYQQAFKMGK